MSDNNVKVTVNLTADNNKKLGEIAAATGSNRTDVINRAISLEKLVQDTIRNGGEVILKEGDKMKHVVLR